ncbi:hypothetical protein [Cohnella algarum]|nr:hypothetical protein [Cohnella algarum]
MFDKSERVVVDWFTISPTLMFGLLMTVFEGSWTAAGVTHSGL